MAYIQTNSYPSVVLLDNENNPITPLVDISSIYLDVQTKADAQVLIGPIEENIKDINNFSLVVDSSNNTTELIDDEDEDVYIVTGLRLNPANNRQIIVDKVKAVDLFKLYHSQDATDLWDALLDKDDNQLQDKKLEDLYARKY